LKAPALWRRRRLQKQASLVGTSFHKLVASRNLRGADPQDDPIRPQPPIYGTPNSSVRCEAESTAAHDHTPCAKLASEQRRADAANAQEFHLIKEFVGECRRYWPGAMIVLRPDGAPTSGAGAPTNPEPAPGADQ